MENKVTKAIMAGASLTIGLVAVALIFAADEWSAYFNIQISSVLSLVCQVLGAYMATFAVLNWMSKGITLGGIYGRPLVLANFLHFFMNAILFSKLALADGRFILWLAAAICSVFALAFARLIFGKFGE